MQKNTAPEPEQVLVGRQPIVDRHGEIHAYELLFRHAPGATTAQIEDDVTATTRLLSNTFFMLGGQQVLGGKKAFVNFSGELLHDEAMNILPRQGIVLEILEHVPPTPALMARCRTLKAMGFEIALDDFVWREEWEPLISLASYIKLDILALSPAQLREQIERLHGRSVRLIAEKVETPRDFEICLKAGFDFFQGYHFARPETLSSQQPDPATLRGLRVLGMLIGETSNAEIEHEIRHDPMLVFRLLKLVNNAAVMPDRTIHSISQAVDLLGRMRLARWLALAITHTGRAATNPALTKTALTRGEMMERLAVGRRPPPHGDELYLTGLLSMIDVILGAPIESCLKDLHLLPEVMDCLLRQTGPCMPYFDLVRMSEQMDAPGIMRVAGGLGLSLALVTRAQLESIAAAEAIVHDE